MIPFKKILSEYGIEISDSRVDLFEKYYRLLIDTNKSVNLTAITEENEVYIKHFLDSLLVCSVAEIPKEGRVIDIGTGAGFPGVPVSIINNSYETTLLESIGKRTDFLQVVKEELELSNVNILCGRAEEYGHNPQYRERYDLSISRAVASLDVLVEYQLPFIKVGGYLVCYKGPTASDEIEEASVAMSKLGGVFVRKVHFNLPDSMGERVLVVIKKEHPSPDKYPRRTGVPSKKPLR